MKIVIEAEVRDSSPGPTQFYEAVYAISKASALLKAMEDASDTIPLRMEFPLTGLDSKVIGTVKVIE